MTLATYACVPSGAIATAVGRLADGDGGDTAPVAVVITDSVPSTLMDKSLLAHLAAASTGGTSVVCSEDGRCTAEEERRFDYLRDDETGGEHGNHRRSTRDALGDALGRRVKDVSRTSIWSAASRSAVATRIRWTGPAVHWDRLSQRRECSMPSDRNVAQVDKFGGLAEESMGIHDGWHYDLRIDTVDESPDAAARLLADFVQQRYGRTP